MTLHGGIARAANSSVTYHKAVRHKAVRRAAGPCAAARQGGTLRAGRHKPAEDDGRALIAEPGDRYKEVRADTLTAGRATSATGGFQASADVTEPVRKSGAGACAVAQINNARGHSPAGARGGRTLVTVYGNSRQPLREIARWDGFQPVGTHRRSFSVRLNGQHIPANSHGRAGVAAYDGDRGSGNDALSVRASRHHAQTVRDAANPANDVMNSTITEFGRQTKRLPAYRNTPGFDSDVFDITPALHSGGDRLTFRFTTRNPGYLLGALFLQTDTRH
ncbi:hypothetical protein [Streptomyces sp. NPDC054765]